MKSKISVTVSGFAGIGKSTVSMEIMKALAAAGIEVENRDLEADGASVQCAVQNALFHKKRLKAIKKMNVKVVIETVCLHHGITVEEHYD